LAAHGASMAFFLSSGMLKELCAALIEGGAYTSETPAALVYKASWLEQQILRGTLANLPEHAEAINIHKTSLILVGNFLGDDYELSKLYDASFGHEFRDAKQ